MLYTALLPSRPRRIAARALTAALTLLLACAAEDELGDPDLDPQALDEDEDSPFPTFEEFEAATPRETDTGTYIVEGDVAIPDIDRLRDYYLRYVRGVEPLALHQVSGVDSSWSAAQAQNLTYCVSTTFGTDYDEMVEAMARAARAWESAADIDFVHLSAQDSNCNANNNNVVFDVSPSTSPLYLARAFFPDYARVDRNVLVTPGAFTHPTYGLVGILRHELGHALGFRHEHTRPESGTCYENNNWRPLSPYDDGSVMHYPWCNGSNSGDLFLTARDRVGAASLYGFGNGNLALMGDNSATSTYCGSTPAHCYHANRINDGSTSTSLGGTNSWTNNGGSLPQSVEIELGHMHAFNRAVLFTTSGYAMRDYEIQYWDGSAWQTAVTETGNTSTSNTYTFDTVYGSRLRVVGQLGPSNQAGYARVNELQVFNDHENLATAAEVSASTTYCSGASTSSHCYDPANVIDSDARTDQNGQLSWTNNGGSLPQWLEIDFVGRRDVSQVEVFTSQGFPIRDYDIQTLQSGSWVTQVSVTGNTALSQNHFFPAVSTTRLRILGLAGPSNQPGYVRLNEVKVY